MTKNHYNSKPIYVSGRAKPIGKVRGDTFYKSIHGTRHFLRFPPAIAIDALAIEEAKAVGAIMIEVLDQDTGTRYRASMAHFEQAGTLFDRGFGSQIYLPFNGWTQSRRGGELQLSWKIGEPA
jgi:hypothetical protein